MADKMTKIALLLLLSLNGAEAHGRLTNVGQGTTRLGNPTTYEDGPVAGGNTGQQWICRHAAKKASQTTLDPNGKLSLKWRFGALHVGDCAVYLSYDVDKAMADQSWFKIANLYDCKSQSGQVVNIDIPPWVKPGAAVLRWDWTALHVWPNIEFYSQCSDVTISNRGQQVIMPKTYKVNTNTAYPGTGQSGVGYRNAFNTNQDQSMTGPSCANGYTGNDCGRTAVGTKRNTIDGGAGGNAGGSPAPPPQPQPQPPNNPACPNHVIQQGTTLGSIAQEYVNKGYQITWQQICAFNSIANCDQIETNEVIIIPVGPCANAPDPNAPAPVQPTPAPVQPTPAPVQPAPAPVQPAPAPVLPPSQPAPGQPAPVAGNPVGIPPVVVQPVVGQPATTKQPVVVYANGGSVHTVAIFAGAIALLHTLI